MITNVTVLRFLSLLFFLFMAWFCVKTIGLEGYTTWRWLLGIVSGVALVISFGMRDRQ